MNLEDLGYSELFESHRQALGLAGYEVARVIAEYKEAYLVKNALGERLAKISGRQMFKAASREDYPCVGDWLAISGPAGVPAVIHQLLPRVSILRRKHTNKSGAQLIGANIDTAFIVESMDNDYNLNRFERYFAMVGEGHIKPAILLNKTDLISVAELDLKLDRLKERFKDTDIIPISALTGKGLAGLTAYIAKGKTYCFLGSSGVGKSTLINKLLGTDQIKTKAINTVTGRGQHTTTGRNMYFLSNGGMVVDNPGMKEIGLTDADAGIADVFDDILQLSLKCKYNNCSHISEAGCAVLAALKKGRLDKDKYANYIKLRKEAKFYQMTELEKRRADRKFGRFLKKAKQDLKKNNDGGRLRPVRNYWLKPGGNSMLGAMGKGGGIMKSKVLVIDDSPEQIDFIKLVLEKDNYDIRAASDGKSGLSAARSFNPDVILLDIMMPGQDGFAACKELKADDRLKTIPVLIMTALGDCLTNSNYAAEKGLELDSEEYLAKPINPDILRAKVRELLAG